MPLPFSDQRRRGVCTAGNDFGCASGFGGDTGAASALSFASTASAMHALYALLSWFM